MVRAYLGLGSNIGDRAGYLGEAVRLLEGPDLHVAGRSSVYETVPWGVAGQATYLNQVVAVDTALTPSALLVRCRDVEAQLGRVRTARWSPRTLDVDILVYGDAVIRDPELTVPHANLPHRAFVLVPLAEVAPGLRLPDGATVETLLAGCPDRESVWPWADAGAGAIGREVRWYDAVPSTNEVARAEAEAGAAEGLVIVAERQTSGRGRLGRDWHSPKGGLWLSIVLRPSLPASRLAVAGLAGSLATAEAIEEVTGLRARLKWPNDILIDGRKAAGLLLEAGAVGAGASLPAWLIAGIGVNVNVPVENLPRRPRFPATSLAAELRRRVQMGPLLRAVLRLFEREYTQLQRSGPGRILERWRGRADTLGRFVQVTAGPETVEGIAEDVDETGALILRTDAGAARTIAAGDVVLERAL